MQNTEQRQFERYYPPEGAIATLKPFEEFGLINDISKGGVAFEYLVFNSDSRGDMPKIGHKRQIDIFVPGRNSRPMTFSCKVVRVEERLLGSYTHSVVPKNRCGIEFIGMEKDTIAALEALLVQCSKCKLNLVENMEMRKNDLQ